MLALLGACAVSPPPAAAKEDALAFRATRLDGTPFDARDLEGSPVLLDFWAVWCPPCVAAIPTLNRLEADFGASGFRVLGIAVYSGDAAEVAAFAREHDQRYAIVLGDDALVERFGVIGYPTYFLVGPDGRVHEKYVGERPDLYETVAAALARWEGQRRKEER